MGKDLRKDLQKEGLIMARSREEFQEIFISQTWFWFLVGASFMGGFMIGVIIWIVLRFLIKSPHALVAGLLSMFIFALIFYFSGISWTLGNAGVLLKNKGRRKPTRLFWNEGPSGNQMKKLDLESVDDEMFLKICQRYDQTESLTYDDLLPIFGGDRSWVKDFRAELFQKKMARWKGADHRGGIELTGKGMFIFQEYLKENGPYPIGGSDNVKK